MAIIGLSIPRSLIAPVANVNLRSRCLRRICELHSKMSNEVQKSKSRNAPCFGPKFPRLSVPLSESTLEIRCFVRNLLEGKGITNHRHFETHVRVLAGFSLPPPSLKGVPCKDVLIHLLLRSNQRERSRYLPCTILPQSVFSRCWCSRL